MIRHRDQRSLKRRKPKKEKLGDIILIVCEGEMTEPKYFTGLKNEWRLHTANIIEVIGEGAVPITVVDRAIELRTKRQKDRNKANYDEVWCVFDHDRHQRLGEALTKAHAKGLNVALSVPSFEFWYLLHFTYTTRPFEDSDAVIRELKAHIKYYTKSKAPLDVLLPKLKTALKHAERVRKHNKTANTNWPSTDVDIVVEKLQSLRSLGSVDYP